MTTASFKLAEINAKIAARKRAEALEVDDSDDDAIESFRDGWWLASLLRIVGTVITSLFTH